MNLSGIKTYYQDHKKYLLGTLPLAYPPLFELAGKGGGKMVGTGLGFCLPVYVDCV